MVIQKITGFSVLHFLILNIRLSKWEIEQDLMFKVYLKTMVKRFCQFYCADIM